MRTIKKSEEMFGFSLKAKQRGKTIGLVPTMGYLHTGHLSLIEAAKKKADYVVVSIFINPLQFMAGEDLNQYPRDLKKDQKALEPFDIDVLFMPDPHKIYDPEFCTFVEVENLSKRMCGKTRPTHFRGVATVVAKLFNIVAPDFDFFGEKDFQQLVIIKRMVMDLNYHIQIIGLPTVREFDGLAMSSRNAYLSPKEREDAVILHNALVSAKEEIEKGEKDPYKILVRIRSMLGGVPHLRLDYFIIVKPDTLEEVKSIRGPVLLAIAAHLGKARLIDNLLVHAK